MTEFLKRARNSTLIVMGSNERPKLSTNGIDYTNFAAAAAVIHNLCVSTWFLTSCPVIQGYEAFGGQIHTNAVWFF